MDLWIEEWQWVDEGMCDLDAESGYTWETSTCATSDMQRVFFRLLAISIGWGYVMLCGRLVYSC